MDCEDLTATQVRKLIVAIKPMLNYHEAALKRMRELGFPEDDPLLQRSLQARDALFSEYVTLYQMLHPTKSSNKGKRGE